MSFLYLSHLCARAPDQLFGAPLLEQCIAHSEPNFFVIDKNLLYSLCIFNGELFQLFYLDMWTFGLGANHKRFFILAL